MKYVEEFFDYLYFKMFKKKPGDDIPKYLSGKGKC
tara:strand:+ start:238 stop:342 length:105 start_codon:yes stop_codon:yes gene_type:complete